MNPWYLLFILHHLFWIFQNPKTLFIFRLFPSVYFRYALGMLFRPSLTSEEEHPFTSGKIPVMAFCHFYNFTLLWVCSFHILHVPYRNTFRKSQAAVYHITFYGLLSLPCGFDLGAILTFANVAVWRPSPVSSPFICPTQVACHSSLFFDPILMRCDHPPLKGLSVIQTPIFGQHCLFLISWLYCQCVCVCLELETSQHAHSAVLLRRQMLVWHADDTKSK